MQVLVAEDEAISRRLLEVLLSKWGYQTVVATNGDEAWNILSRKEIKLAILDWMMPGMDGVEICKKLRSSPELEYTYVIMLTARGESEDVVSGLDSGADDYVTKPFSQAELRSRLRAGERVLELQHKLVSKVKELEQALAHVRRLQGLLPICMHCKKVRDDRNVWKKLEEYVEEHSEAQFSHALCRECLEKHYPEVAQRTATRRKE
jgi:sigma-B regulation protein RsbU (phosphoserine phosphatase)